MSNIIEYKVTMAVVGSRKFHKYNYMKEQCDGIVWVITNHLFNQGAKPKFHIISGGAKGADSLAASWAKERKYQFHEYLPAFEKHGTYYRAKDYYDRDVLMADLCSVLIAFLVNKLDENRGSRITIKAALDRMKQVHVFYNS